MTLSWPDSAGSSVQLAVGSEVTVCRAPLLDGEGVSHAFATRRTASGGEDLGYGAAGAFVDGTERLMRQLGFDPGRLFRVKQVHGDRVKVVGPDADAGRLALTEADALVSDVPGVLLGVRTADCVPVLLLHERPFVVAAVHAGWRGIVAGVLERTVEVIERRFAGSARGITAAIGPCVGPCCYEVSEEVAARFAGTAGVVQPRSAARPHLDLRRAVSGILERSGLLPARIAACHLFTCCRSDLFHSYRRDGAAAGRQLSAIGLRGGRALRSG